MLARLLPARTLLSAILSAAIVISLAAEPLVDSGQDVPPTAQIEVAQCDVPVTAIFQADASLATLSSTWLPGTPSAPIAESIAAVLVRNGLSSGPGDTIAVDRDSLVARSVRLQV
jgi:hypothetical protein